MDRPVPVSGTLTRTRQDGKTEELKFSGEELKSLATIKSRLTGPELSQLVVEFSDGQKRRPFRFIDA